MRLFVGILFWASVLCSCATKKNIEAFPFYKQASMQDCGPACLKMILKYHGEEHSLSSLCRITNMDTLTGTNLYDLDNAIQSLGYSTEALSMQYAVFKKMLTSPCIVHWKENHFIVVYKIMANRVYVADPAVGLLEYDESAFCDGWLKKDGKYKDEGAVLFIKKQAISQ